MIRASVSEAKANLSALLDRVRGGETVTITNRGRAIARLVPAAGSVGGDDGARLDRLERAGLVRRSEKKLDVDAFLARPKARSRKSVLGALLDERRATER